MRPLERQDLRAGVLSRPFRLRQHVQGPSDDDIFFGIVQRGAAMIMLKDVGVEPVPNYTYDIKQGVARWDAYLHVPDPDALAAEFSSRGVEFFQPLRDDADGLRGFEEGCRRLHVVLRASALMTDRFRWLEPRCRPCLPAESHSGDVARV